jgi:hypothetical protein
MPAYPGRPREFKYEKRRELINHINEGATVEEAAEIVGITLRTVQRAAKLDECFDHDLHLALHAAPVDAERLVQRAARTHWRAAAWLLERTDPDRFAKRPPNSCSPGTLMDISDWLIETALEATPPAAREAVYRRMRAVADKALNVLMPDQYTASHALVRGLPERPMPLSLHEWKKTLQVVGDPHAPAVGASSAPAGSLPPPVAGSLPATLPPSELAAETAGASSHPQGHSRDATHRRGAAGEPANRLTPPTATAPDATAIADPVSYYRRHPWKSSLPYERPSDSIGGFRLKDAAGRNGPLEEDEEEEDVDDATPAGVSAVDSVAANASAATSAECDPLPPHDVKGPAPPAPAGVPSFDPPNGGIMSQKIAFRDIIGRATTTLKWAVGSGQREPHP